MRSIVTACFIFFSLLAQSKELTKLNDLASLLWKNRIIIVNDISDKAAHNESIEAIFEKNMIEIDDRHIVWFVIKAGRISSNYSGKLSKVFLNNTLVNYKLSQTEVILIGKDGGIKSRSDRFDLERLFSEIDAMPMRQNEMQK